MPSPDSGVVSSHASGEFSPHRVEALSDGVFGVALTLLTFDLVTASKMGPEESGLLRHLGHHWPTLLAYMIGFLTILVCWLNHRYVFTFIGRVGSGFVWLNGLQLALVAAVPLPTSILAENLTGSEVRAALLIYGATFFLMAASFFVITRHARRSNCARADVDAPQMRGLEVSYGLATAWTVVCLAVAWFAVYPALVMWALMFAVFAFPRASASAARRLVR